MYALCHGRYETLDVMTDRCEALGLGEALPLSRGPLCLLGVGRVGSERTTCVTNVCLEARGCVGNPIRLRFRFRSVA